MLQHHCNLHIAACTIGMGHALAGKQASGDGVEQDAPLDEDFDPEFSWWTPWYTDHEDMPAAVAERTAAEHSVAAEDDAAELAAHTPSDLRAEIRKRQAALMTALSAGQGVSEAAARLKRVRAAARETTDAGNVGDEAEQVAGAGIHAPEDFSSGGFF